MKTHFAVILIVITLFFTNSAIPQTTNDSTKNSSEKVQYKIRYQRNY